MLENTNTNTNTYVQLYPTVVRQTGVLCSFHSLPISRETLFLHHLTTLSFPFFLFPTISLSQQYTSSVNHTLLSFCYSLLSPLSYHLFHFLKTQEVTTFQLQSLLLHLSPHLLQSMQLTLHNAPFCFFFLNTFSLFFSSK